MKTYPRKAIAVASAIFMGLAGCQPQPEAPLHQSVAARQSAVIDEQYIVTLTVDLPINLSTATAYASRQTIMSQYVNQLLKRFNISAASLGHVYSSAVRGFVVRLTDQQVAFLRNRLEVASVEADKITDAGVGDAIYDDGARIATSTQQIPWGITYVGGSVNYTGTNVAWIVDTGIDLTHPDLNVDASRGFNALKIGAASKTLTDTHGHGTHVAGIIAAKNNDIGVVGVAAGAKVIPVKIAERPSTMKVSDVIAGLDYVMTNARSGDVVNLSLGVEGSATLDQAVMNIAARGDVFITASAGNVLQGNTDANKISPARLNAPNLYTLSALDNKGAFAAVSCSGNPPIDFAAPGVSIRSTTQKGRYGTFAQGTTMATAHASGILLANGGVIYAKGTVTGDRDGIPDPKASRIP